MAVDTAAPAAPVHVRIDAHADPGSSGAAAISMMEQGQQGQKEHFGQCLRRARESRDIALSDVALKTKVARSTLELLEKGDLDLLPTGVYARGFIRSFARAVGIDETEPLLLYEKALEARAAAEKTKSTTPEIPEPEILGLGDDDESMAPRRGLGLAVFVIILLLIATITLSLLLRRPPTSGEGLSVAPASLPCGPASVTDSLRALG